MRRLPLLLALTLALPTVACGSGAAPTAPPQDPPIADALAPDARVASFSARMNQHRASVGCAPLVADAAVAEVARQHSADMRAQGYFSHTGRDGRSPFDRLRDAGVRFAAAGENIASGFGTAETVLAAWLGSPGHRANIEQCRYTHHGVGVVEGVWTHVFVRRP